MFINTDGTPYCSESIREMIDLKFKEARNTNHPFPDLSDMLGSDWGCNFPPPNNIRTYYKQAIDMAKLIYDDDAGFFIDKKYPFDNE